MARHIQEDTAKALKLVEHLEKAMPTVLESHDLKEEFLAQFPHYIEDIKLHKDRLKEILPVGVVGETSSGKSSFLNLMLKAPILPTAHLPCTAGIIKIQKCSKLAVIMPNGKVEKPDDASILTDKPKAAKYVRNILEKKISRQIAGGKKDSMCTEITVHWPFKCDLLKDNVSIVDTPGFGENKEMDDLLMSYLHKSVAFLYIVNSENAGGIQYDRIEKIMKDQFEYCEKHHIDNLMDPGRTLFFFNKWDRISVGEDYDEDEDW